MYTRHEQVDSGSRFGYLTTIGDAVRGHDAYYFPCMCDCGKPTFVKWARLNGSGKPSCGCRQGNRTHGFRRTRLYSIWSNMKQRCFNSNCSGFPLYGGRGITVCEEWMKFSAFQKWAEQSGYDDTLTLERNDVNDGYNPDNCRWIPHAEQAANRRSVLLMEYEGERRSLKEWSSDDRCVVKYHTLYHRVKNGWDMHSAMTIPAGGRR